MSDLGIKEFYYLAGLFGLVVSGILYLIGLWMPLFLIGLWMQIALSFSLVFLVVGFLLKSDSED